MSFMEVAKRTISREALLARKNSPHIFFVAGLAGVIGGTVLACRATLKLEKTLEECKNDIDTTKTLHENEEGLDRAVSMAYVRNTFKIVKIYAPAAGVMTLSVVALSTSHVTLTRRNTALMSAYALVQTAYENYRERVRQEIGEERELDLYRGVGNKEIGSGEDPDAIVIDPNKFSPFARFFDEGSEHWVKDSEINRLFVQAQQNYLNHRLQVFGHVFLNEAYDALGLERSKAGQVVGWIRNKHGTSYIDFGLFDQRNSPFLNGWERNILLDFNVDGVIYNKM